MDDQGFFVATRAAVGQASSLAVQYSFSILGALFLLVVGWFVARVIHNWALAGLSKIHGFDETLVRFFANILRYVILILVFITVLGQFGVQTASIIAALGAAGLAVGLALQGTLQNIAAGIMLLVLRPFRVGEYIETGAISGTIQEIGLFATELKSADGLYRLAPNSTLWNTPVTNYSRLDSRRYELTVSVPESGDLKATERMLMEMAERDRRVLDTPPPRTFIDKLDGSSTSVTLRYWVATREWFDTTRDLNRQAKFAMDEMNSQQAEAAE